MKHVLKLEPAYFEAVLNNLKTFEIRYNDRGYQAGDTVILKEYDPSDMVESFRYSGREITKTIGWVTNFAQKENWCVFSLLEYNTHTGSQPAEKK